MYVCIQGWWKKGFRGLWRLLIQEIGRKFKSSRYRKNIRLKKVFHRHLVKKLENSRRRKKLITSFTWYLFLNNKSGKWFQWPLTNIFWHWHCLVLCIFCNFIHFLTLQAMKAFFHFHQFPPKPSRSLFTQSNHYYWDLPCDLFPFGHYIFLRLFFQILRALIIHHLYCWPSIISIHNNRS